VVGQRLGGGGAHRCVWPLSSASGST
jgi:hypothetical protein